MKYKITLKAGRADNQEARDLFANYILAIRDGLDLVHKSLNIYPDYEPDFIQFEVNVTDNLLELSKDKHFKFINKLSALFEYEDLLICEKID